MLKISRVFFLSVLLLPVTACLYEPFQPSPPEYVMWTKKNVEHQGVKKAMRDCGYKDLEGYGGDRNRTLEDLAKRQNCMFRDGFQYDDGYKGICSLKGIEKIAACHTPN
jgi:hypothetical protein